MSEIYIPMPELILVDDLKVDGDNPNVMSPVQFNALKRNIQRFGFIVPVITNNELVIADGEHRMKAGRELGMEKIPVIKLDVKEVDRKLIRQVMNKLRGEHNPTRDKSEFDFILMNDGRKDMIDLLAMKESDILKLMEDRQPLTIPPITPEYMEEYNYIVVFSRNALDWNVLTDKLRLPEVRTNEEIDKYKKIRSGVGRVIEASVLLKLMGMKVPKEDKVEE